MTAKTTNARRAPDPRPSAGSACLVSALLPDCVGSAKGQSHDAAPPDALCLHDGQPNRAGWSIFPLLCRPTPAGALFHPQRASCLAGEELPDELVLGVEQLLGGPRLHDPPLPQDRDVLRH